MCSAQLFLDCPDIAVIALPASFLFKDGITSVFTPTEDWLRGEYT